MNKGFACISAKIASVSVYGWLELFLMLDNVHVYKSGVEEYDSLIEVCQVSACLTVSNALTLDIQKFRS